IEPADRAEWLRMRLALWPDQTPEELSAEIDELARTGEKLAVFVAARPEGGLGGFVEASLRPYAEGCTTRPVGYLEGWYVDPDVRRQGVGAALVRAAEQWAREQGCREMGSDTWLDNLTGWHAHRALGYREVERLITFIKPL
ncbi:MAG: aminoglycoside 6'-N-acetyltransferase, partial [Rudaea sp.]